MVLKHLSSLVFHPLLLPLDESFGLRNIYQLYYLWQLPLQLCWTEGLLIKIWEGVSYYRSPCIKDVTPSFCLLLGCQGDHGGPVHLIVSFQSGRQTADSPHFM